jgi:metal-responsive CopG/Arc/MetJ family transcriptional regulator
LGGRVPAELIAAVDAYAAKAGINRSDAMRRLIEAGLKRRPKA